MLPSKCPLCGKDLILDLHNMTARCPIIIPPKHGYTDHYCYTIYGTRTGSQYLMEWFDTGNYRIRNGSLIAPQSNLITTEVFSSGKTYESIFIIKNNRIPPTITENKLRTYIAFS